MQVIVKHNLKSGQTIEMEQYDTSPPAPLILGVPTQSSNGVLNLEITGQGTEGVRVLMYSIYEPDPLDTSKYRHRYKEIKGSGELRIMVNESIDLTHAVLGKPAQLSVVAYPYRMARPIRGRIRYAATRAEYLCVGGL